MEVKKEEAEKKSDCNHDDSDSLHSAFVFIQARFYLFVNHLNLNPVF